MNITPRPSIALNSKSMLSWNSVPEAKSYTFKIVNKQTSDPLWETEVTELISVTPEKFASEKPEDNYKPPQCKTDDKLCACEYPDERKPLEEVVSYLFTAVAKDSNGKPISEFQTDVILLEEEAQKAVNEFQNLIFSEGTPNLQEQWLRTEAAVSVFGRTPTLATNLRRPWIIHCLQAIFSNQ